MFGQTGVCDVCGDLLRHRDLVVQVRRGPWNGGRGQLLREGHATCLGLGRPAGWPQTPYSCPACADCGGTIAKGEPVQYVFVGTQPASASWLESRRILCIQHVACPVTCQRQPAPPPPAAETRVIYRASITLSNGYRIYARDYGKRAFPIHLGENR
jgi:hypothetical protein